MTNGILCATDFSESSNEALKWSIDLAKKLDLHLTILYAYRLFRQMGEVAELKKIMEVDAKQKFDVMEKEYLAGKGISYDLKIEVGFFDDRIAEHLKKNKITFLVVGKSITFHNKETFDKLIDNLQMPLVIVPETIN